MSRTTGHVATVFILKTRDVLAAHALAPLKEFIDEAIEWETEEQGEQGGAEGGV